ncbi:MAG: response regulator transcription factor [Eubacteriales bacterium]|nr:response regulator transcription factor [Eubacteriales bacterium]
MEKIYIIEDDMNIRNLLTIAVNGFQYEAIAFENAEDALMHIEADRPDMAIFDLMLPGMDGITAIRKIREMPSVSRIPILILTAKDKEIDKVAGLDGGADDYMVKPFGILELGARIRSLLRRSAGTQQKLIYKDLVMDEDRHEVTVDGNVVELTNKEYGLLRYLLERPSFVATRDELLNSIWGYEYDGESRTVDMHIKSLRQKLGDEDGSLIQTVRGIGYKLK